MKRLLNYSVIFLISLFSTLLQAQEVVVFKNIDELFHYAEQKNIVFENDKLQQKLAEVSYNIAKLNSINPKIPVSAQVIDNISLQKNYIPGEIFGQPIGSYREITLGQQYSSVFSVQPQFDLVNLANWNEVKTAKINKELVENQAKINKKTLFENLNSVYHNILLLQAQQKIWQENTTIAQEILRIVTNRYESGISRKQEANEAEVNYIATQDKLAQIEVSIQQQYIILHALLENKAQFSIQDSVENYKDVNNVPQSNSQLLYQQAILKTKMAEQELKQSKLAHLPILSFVSSFNWQHLSNDSFFHANGNGFNFSYIGLKLSWDFPTSVSKIATYKNNQLNFEIQKNNEILQKINTEKENNQLNLEFQKSLIQYENAQKMYELKKDTFEKDKNIYMQNILSLDKLLISQNEMLLQELNSVSALANIGFNKNKILINNNL